MDSPMEGNEQAMAANQQDKTRLFSRTVADITPTQNLHDSFSSDAEAKKEQMGKSTGGAVNTVTEPNTPPASPEFRLYTHDAANNSFDAPLFSPGSCKDNIPLFSESDQQYPLSAIRESSVAVATPSVEGGAQDKTLQPVEPPTHAYPAILGIQTKEDAENYYRNCYAELKQLAVLRRTLPLPSRSQNFTPDTASADGRQLSKLTKSAGVSKPRPNPKKAAAKAQAPAAPVAATNPSQKPVVSRRRAPKARVPAQDARETPAAGQGKHTRKAPTKQPEFNGLAWYEIDDFTPPLATLDASSKDLHVEWKGTKKYLSQDPDREHLHPQELRIASDLRLDGKVYLNAKRLIFKAKVKALQEGRGFSKTHAQTAVKMDVNKASQLYEAFDRVGWFDRRHF